MKKKVTKIVPISVIIVVITFIYLHAPIVAGDWRKQTIYLWLLNSCHIQAKDAKPKMLLIDDDSGNGVFDIKKICDELQIKATFAIIPTMMNQQVCDSLRIWQNKGFDIAIHGYHHDDWRKWGYDEVIADIEKCERWLANAGFNINRIKYIVTPHSANNKAIREAVKDRKYQMVTGADIVNPDTTVFQMGRVFISRDTNIEEIEKLLNKARKRNAYVIFGTHSSMEDEFSREKTKAILQMAIRMGFEY